jgi:hypothetical protein
MESFDRKQPFETGDAIHARTKDLTIRSTTNGFDQVIPTESAPALGWGSHRLPV